MDQGEITLDFRIVAPDRVRLLVAREEEGWAGAAGHMAKNVSERRELTSFKQA